MTGGAGGSAMTGGAGGSAMTGGAGGSTGLSRLVTEGVLTATFGLASGMTRL